MGEVNDVLKTYLLKNFGFNEPIFSTELNIEGISPTALRQNLKRLVDSGFLSRFDQGIYFIPKNGLLLDNAYLDPMQVVIRKYISDGKDTYGYITGASFANELGLSTQMPAVVDIVSNKEATNGRVVKIGPQLVRIRKGVTYISRDNADLLQILDCIAQCERYSELKSENAGEKIKKYIRDKNFTQKQLADVSRYITGYTAKKLIEWGIIYEFAA